jgi:hypothetical protein
MKVWYEVRFQYYKHNSGRADNGQYLLVERRNTPEEATALADKVLEMIADQEGRYHWFNETYHIDGYPTRFDGIYKLTEEKVGKEKVIPLSHSHPLPGQKA